MKPETPRDPQPADRQLDPVFLNARREALVILAIWVAALLWAVPYCYLNGYHTAADQPLATTWGIPSWLFWGIGVPWLVADVITVWLCFAFIKDDDLGESPEQREAAAAAAREAAPDRGGEDTA